MPEHAVLPLYLAAASLIAFLIMLLDLRRDREGKDPLPPAVWIAASAAGGAPGVLLAFAVMRTHIMKATVGRFFCGLCFTIVWGVMLLAATGLIDLTLQSLCQAAARSHTPLVVYLLAVNLAAFSLFAADKRQARRDGTRIPEAVLLGTGLLGGAPGGMLAMQLFRHKTKKASFVLWHAAHARSQPHAPRRAPRPGHRIRDGAAPAGAAPSPGYLPFRYQLTESAGFPASDEKSAFPCLK